MTASEKNKKAVSLNENQERVLRFLFRSPDTYFSPTLIGSRFECGYNKASSWACRRLKKLVALGFVTRQRGAKYRITKEGQRWVNESKPKCKEQ